jgi:CRISPR-associated protein Csx10
MPTIDFTLKLCSDALFSSGNNVPGQINSDLSLDEFGFPYVGGNRLKGLLSEECANTLSALQSPRRLENAARRIFGQGGGRPTRLFHFGNAEIPMATRVGALNLAPSPLTTHDISRFYCRIRRQTSIDENGVAEPGSLRTMRVLRKGTELVGQITYSGFLLDEDDRALLTICAKALRRGGRLRNRGLGRIQLCLHFSETVNLEAYFATLQRGGPSCSK